MIWLLPPKCVLAMTKTAGGCCFVYFNQNKMLSNAPVWFIFSIHCHRSSDITVNMFCRRIERISTVSLCLPSVNHEFKIVVCLMQIISIVSIKWQNKVAQPIFHMAAITNKFSPSKNDVVILVNLVIIFYLIESLVWVYRITESRLSEFCA